MLQEKFVPVGIDQFNQRQQQDAEGEFWRKLMKQGPRKDPNDTTQGLYLASPGGELFAYNNNRGPRRILALMNDLLKRYTPDKDVALINIAKRDPRYDKTPPPGTVIIRTHAKVLGGYDEAASEWQGIFQKAVSRDTLWITKEEMAALKQGQLPTSLTRRVTRFHLVDNTRGEPTFWRPNDVREADWNLEDGTLTGKVRLERVDGSSGYDADVLGTIAFEEGELTQFDLVAKGQYWGAGRYTGQPPAGKFPVAVSFRLPKKLTVFDQIAPQGTKGWRRYLRPE